MSKVATFGSGIHEVSFQDELTCDACHSKNIREHELGYVCEDCGIIIENSVLEYHHPYNEEALQHAVLSGTTLGTRQERRHYSNSRHLHQLNKLHSIQESEKAVDSKARKEIKRIFEHLHIPHTKIQMTFITFKELRSRLQPGTKYRSPEKLVPITIYTCMKLHNISINEGELLEVSQINKKEFNAFKLQISKFMPYYAERNRKDYILQKIMEIREHFSLDMAFYYTAKAILYKLWSTINCTKDDVIAGLTCSITALCCHQDREDLTVNAICTKLGIMMSTIQSQVKRRIIDKYKIPNFESLVKSTDLLKKILMALKIIEEKKFDLKTKDEEHKGIKNYIITNDIIQFTLTEEGTPSSLQGEEEEENYHFIVKDVNDNPIFMEIKTRLGHKLENLLEKKKSYKRTREPLFEFSKCRYYRVKGPP